MKSLFIIIPNSSRAVRVSDIDSVLLHKHRAQPYYQLDILYMDGEEAVFPLPDSYTELMAKQEFVNFIDNLNSLQS
jgi:hypothetical protein